MPKWRPAARCLYVIPEVHGALGSLQSIFNSILPLRFHGDMHDCIVMLGDYCDKGSDTYGVLESLIETQKVYGSNFICLRGNHEQLFLNALRSESNFRNWLSQGALSTVESYIRQADLKIDSMGIPFTRFLDIVPRHHIEWLQSLPTSYCAEGYMFFHGGVDLQRGIMQTSDDYLMFDHNTSKNVKMQVKLKQRPLQDLDYVLVGSHNYQGKLPFVYSKYFMLGGGAPNNLIVFELNSTKCAMIRLNRSKIYAHKFHVFE